MNITPVSLTEPWIRIVAHLMTLQVTVVAPRMRGLLRVNGASGGLCLPHISRTMKYTLFFLRFATAQERVLMGLTGKTRMIPMRIGSIPGKGRGTPAEEFVPKGTYFHEHKSVEVYERSKRVKKLEYAINDEPCMVLEVQTPQGWFCLDATRAYNTLGCLCSSTRG